MRMRVRKERKAPRRPTRLSPWEIEPDPQNPRQESEDEIKGDDEFVRLTASVAEFGVLVPLVVRESEEKPGRWVLIDGERRLRAARTANRRTVPVRVVEEGREVAFAQAFHIHTLRKQWGQTAQVRSVRRMIDLISSEEPETADNAVELRKRIGELTGYRRDRLAELILLAEVYKEEVLEEVDAKRLRFSHLVQIEESFINQLKSTFPDLLRELGVEAVRTIMLDKARHKVIDTRVLMDDLVPVFSRAETQGEKRHLKGLLRKFLDERQMLVEEVVREFNEKYPAQLDDLLEGSREAQGMAGQLRGMLDSMEAPSMRELYPKAARDLVAALEKLRGTITAVLRRLRA